MIKTFKLRIYPTKRQEKALLKIGSGCNEVWNKLDTIQSNRCLKYAKLKEIIKTDKRTKKEIKKAEWSLKEKCPLEIPQKNGYTKTEDCPVLIPDKVLYHFVAQYTDFGKKITDGYSPISTGTISEICCQYRANAALFEKTKLKNYVEKKFHIKNRINPNWIPFQRGNYKIQNREKINIFGMDISCDTNDTRNLYDLLNNKIPEMEVFIQFKDGRKIDPFKNGTITRDSLKKWYFNVSINILQKADRNSPIAELSLRKEDFVGIDPGFNTTLTLSTGEKIKRPNLIEGEKALDKHSQELRNLKKKAAKSKGGKARIITKEIDGKQVNIKYSPSLHIIKKYRRKQRKVTAQKREWEWKTANYIAGLGKSIVMGNPNLKAMQKIYGKSVLREAIHTLAKCIKQRVEENAYFFADQEENNTTCKCSECGQFTGPKGITGLNIREWECSNCRTKHDRDINAAKNIVYKYLEERNSYKKPTNKLKMGRKRHKITKEFA